MNENPYQVPGTTEIRISEGEFRWYMRFAPNLGAVLVLIHANLAYGFVFPNWAGIATSLIGYLLLVPGLWGPNPNRAFVILVLGIHSFVSLGVAMSCFEHGLGTG